MCAWANGLDDVTRVWVGRPSGVSEFTVKNCHPREGAEPADDPVWKWISADFRYGPPGIPGQGSDLDPETTHTPGTQTFPNHEIVKRNGCWFDPSYGVTASSPTDYTQNAVGGWWETGTNRWTRPVDLDAEHWKDLDFSWAPW